MIPAIAPIGAGFTQMIAGEEFMQGHMIAFQSAMTRSGEMVKAKPDAVTSVAAIRAALGSLVGQKN